MDMIKKWQKRKSISSGKWIIMSLFFMEALFLSAAGIEASGHVKVSAGGYHTAALKSDGTVLIWGLKATGRWQPLQVPGPSGEGRLDGIIDIAAGAWHTLALRPDGTVWAWGSNREGQMGTGNTEDSSVPVQVQGAGGRGYLSDAKAVSAGGRHNVAIRADGTVWAWGSNRYGQLGTGTQQDSGVPVQVRGPEGQGYLTDAVLVAAGFQHTFAVRADGTVWAWGSNRYGQMGTGTQQASGVPVQVRGKNGQGYLTGVKSISAGWDHSVILMADGTVWTCGMSWNGLLGNGEKKDSSVLVQVKGEGGKGNLTNVAAVSAHWRHNLAVRADGTVWAWGRNQDGQLGTGTIVPAAWKGDPDISLYEYLPVQVRGVRGEGFLTAVEGIAAACEHSAAFTTDGTVFVWGINNNEQLGLGSRGYPWMHSNPAQMPLNLKK